MNLSRRNSVFYILILLLLWVTGCGEQKSQESNQDTTASPAQFSSTDLRQASLQGQLARVKKMVRQGLDVSQTDYQGRTPLMFASFNGHTKVAGLLLEEEAKVNHTDNAGRTALMLAASGPFPETAELLINHGAKVNAVDNAEKWTPLMFAAAEGNLEVVEVLLENQADACQKDNDGETALTFAQDNDHPKVVELLKKHMNSC